MSPDLVCLGEPLVEFNEREPGLFVQGFGGDTSNCAVAAARQGARAGYVSAVGSDPFGDRLLALWRAEGVDATHVRRDPDHPTGHYFVTHGAAGHEFTYFRAGSAASRLGPGDLPEACIGAARVLHVSGISQAIGPRMRAAVDAAIGIARERGVLVSYDTNLRLKLWPLETAREVIHAALAHADVALPGLDDARALTGLDSPAEIVRFYRDLGPGIVALTLGADGVLVAAGDRVEHVPGHRVRAVDATAAGDTFDGAFLAAVLRGEDPFSAARHGNAAAALATTGYGAVAPMPDLAAVRELLAGAGGLRPASG